MTYTADDHVVVDFCGFPVQVDVTGRLAVIVFTDDAGNLVRTIEPAAGPVSATLTNLDTQERLVVHNAGPGQARALPDGFSFTTYGPWVSFARPTGGEPGIFLVKGRQTKVFTSTDFQWEFDGRVEDLCAALA